MQITFSHSETIAQDITTYWFIPEHKLRYQAGQYVDVSIPHENPDQKGTSRTFTLSSSPTEDCLGITLKHKSDESTFKRALRSLSPGSKAIISNPIGDFVLPINKGTPLIFIASGIGITPVRSIVKYLTDKKEVRELHIIYAAKNEDQVVYKDLFDSYGANLHIFLTEPSSKWSSHTGRPSAEQIIKLTGSRDNALYFLSGLQSMVEDMQQQLMRQFGIERSRITLDYFPGYSEL